MVRQGRKRGPHVGRVKEARLADPTCFRVVNSTGTWCDYYMGRRPQPWQQSVYDYLQRLKDGGAQYEAVGLAVLPFRPRPAGV